MSLPDLIAQLREARPVAPSELRERVRLIAVEAGVPPRRWITWRRAAVVLVPVAAAILAATVLLPRDEKHSVVGASEELTRAATTPGVGGANPVFGVIPSFAARDDRLATPEAVAGAAALSQQRAVHKAADIPGPSPTRIQRYTAVLDLELPSPDAVSAASRKAVAIATSLSGYQQAVRVRTTTKAGYAHIVLRVPSGNVREAIRRLSGLGKITAENVAIQDLQVQVNAKDKHIGRLEVQLAALVAQPQTEDIELRIASVTAQIEQLQRSRAATVRAAHYATIDLQLATKQAAAPVKEAGPGPFHNLGIAFHWAWIGAVYALALGAPLVALAIVIWLLARTVRRRREDALLAS
jgi:hypothetical protein